MPPHPFVALVSLPEFWGTERDPQFLGPWCLFPDHPELWEKSRARILPVPWSDRVVFDEAAARVSACVTSLMAFLSEYLNSVHSSSHSQRYWKILLWAWVNNFVSETFDRLFALRSAFEKWGDFHTSVIGLGGLGSIAEIRPEFQKQVLELVRFSAILDYWNKEYPAIQLPDRCRLSRINAEDGGIPIANSGNTLPMEIGELLYGFVQYRRDETESLLASLPVESTNIESSGLDADLPSNEPLSVPLRTGLLEWAVKDECEAVVRHLLPSYFPTGCLEQFPAIKEQITAKYAGNPRVILTGLGCQESFSFRLLSAEAVERGARLICVQHGAMYSTYDSLPCRSFEQEISDNYVGWGWAQENERIVNLPSPPLSLHLVVREAPASSRDQRKIVLLANEMCPFLMDFRSSLKAWGSDRYFSWQLRFLQALPPELRRRVIVRFKSRRDYPVYRYLQRCFPTVAIESKEISFESRMAECRIAVADCSSHVHAEAMMLRPVLLFWDADIWRETAVAAEMTRGLARAGIYCDSPELAAERLCSVYESADAWWDQDEVHRARELYIQNLFRPSPHWKTRWREYLTSVVGGAS